MIFAGGAIRSAVRISEIGTELAELDAIRNRNEVRFLIAGNYIELCKLANQKKVLQENISLARTVAEVMQSRVDNGAALKTDITRIELMIKNLEYSLIKIEGAQKIVGRELANALGLDMNMQIVPKDEFGCHLLNDVTDTDALENSPVIKAADAMVRMSEQKVEMAKSDRYRFRDPLPCLRIVVHVSFVCLCFPDDLGRIGRND